MHFFQRLEETSTRNTSLLCVGLDPDPKRLPDWCLEFADPVLTFNRHIIDLTCDLVCAYKPNIAFYEALGGNGWSTLYDTILYAHSKGIPVILDAKRGDIGSSAEKYAHAVFQRMGADAVTVNPYMGWDAVEPFVRYAERGVFVLCLTSNAGAQDFQMLDGNGRPLYEHVAEQAAGWNERGNIGLVAGATYPDELGCVRLLAPDLWILLPGVGAQGANLEIAVDYALRRDGSGVIVNASRAVYWADDPREAALRLRDQINAVRARKLEQVAQERRARPRASTDPHKVSLALALHDVGAIQFGNFTLQSGVQSPIYVDLRLLVSKPEALALAASEYGRILENLVFDRLAAIPYAGLPLGTAVALQTRTPLIYPRKEVKSYGTRRAIEGWYHAGETVVVLDDLITSGASKLDAIKPLRDAGLLVHDVVVLIDRESGGSEELAAHHINVHSVFKLRDLLDILVHHERISADQRAQVENFLQMQTA
ncbi:orotidine-5'-phosphate decarboxylase [Kallotenue papyrolyticum]|uniref:orotidine-5'-phosphate decarboxylase n=1 Tax=Kallotenue papyrolyticum TaxID=1325125 RepID=UPI00049248D6|nr:orotidine-5'-phosphate decarboxylase [Kallotenue papyrolyticum]